ncbi:MAG: ABC transporter ATP-binding protein/permease [Hyphomicrobiales bacterium]
MKNLAILIGFAAAFLLVLGLSTGDAQTIGLGSVGVALAVTTWLSAGISRFLMIFAAIFGAEFVIFGAIFVLDANALWPTALADFVPPESLPITVGIFGIIVFAISFIPGIVKIMRIADRFFDGHDITTVKIWPFPSITLTEQTLARTIIVALILINQGQVGISVRLSFFNRDWFNAIQEKDSATFWSLLYTVFLFWAVIYIVIAIFEYVIQSHLMIRWRRWLTSHYIGDWLNEGSHYRMALSGTGADNPDQRIAEDVDQFIGRTYSFSISLLAQVSSLVSFSIILWGISANFTIPGTEIAIPGFLFWVAVLYSGFGTFVTHVIGRRLIRLNFEQQRYEADFRFSLARLREYAEQVALLGGEKQERRFLMDRFGNVIRNFFAIVARRKQLMMFTASYGQISPIIPYVVAAPFYFIGKIQLGVLTQTASSFGRVEGSLSFFIDAYVSLADYLSVIQRLVTFDDAIEKARRIGNKPPRIVFSTEATTGISISDLTLSLPDGREIVSAEVQFEPGQSVLISGPSGSGKSTLLRAIAGIWPYGHGKIITPVDTTLMLLPQKPYLPSGSLRDCVAYPSDEGTYLEKEIIDALKIVGLDRLITSLDDATNWSQRLSGGEQQRLAIARALLARPDWLFLDEATSALDEDSEAFLYRALKEHLKTTTLISIGHRSTLKALHDKAIRMEPEDWGGFRVVRMQGPPERDKK